MPAATVLEMATLGGARALGLDREIGSLEVGKKADIALIRRGRPHAVPTEGAGAAEQLVYSHNAADVEVLIVGGTRVVGDGALLSADCQAITRRADTARRHLLHRIHGA
jgi:cytosine/adenosine deaminase-related metal-dependent hydrolase